MAEKQPLPDDLADVLAHMVVGWEDRLGVDLATHPEVQRVMERFRKSRYICPWCRDGDHHECIDDTDTYGPPCTCLHRTDAEVRADAHAVRDAHDPKLQKDNPYERCSLCHFTRHPCEAYEMADAVLRLLHRYE